MKKQNATELLLFIKERFQPGENFDAKKLKKAYLDDNLNVTYFMAQLMKKGEILQIKRGSWSLPGSARNEKNIHLPILYISKAEKNILEAIFNTDFHSEINGLSRFPLDKLKAFLSEDEIALLPDLLPKLKNINVVSCIGDGSKGKILEIKDELFLKYMTEIDLIKEISLTDLEIDQKIKRFISSEEKKRKKIIELAEEIAVKEDELTVCTEEIEKLSKDKERLEKEILNLRGEVKKIEVLIDDETESQFIQLMSKMDPERRRNIFKKLLS